VRILRPLNRPRPVRVRVDRSGRPAVLHFRGRARRVTDVLEVWRIDEEWWRDPVSRRYTTLLLEGGRILTLYQDLRTGRWYLQEG